MAQLGEWLIPKLENAGSNPAICNFLKEYFLLLTMNVEKIKIKKKEIGWTSSKSAQLVAPQ